jgi:hypothetical protein
MAHQVDEENVLIAAVPLAAVDELEFHGIAAALPVYRGTAMEALVTIGMDSATLVTLLQAPDSIRAFASWIRDRCVRDGTRIEVIAKQGSRRLRLTVDGEVDIGVVADFIAAAFADPHSQD